MTNPTDFTLFHVEAQCRSVQTKGINQLKITMDSQENCSPKQISTIANWHGKTGHLIFLEEVPDDLAEQIKNLPKLQADEFGITPGQRLQRKIYKLWKFKEDAGNEVGGFNTFYSDTMEKICDSIDQKCV